MVTYKGFEMTYAEFLLMAGTELRASQAVTPASDSVTPKSTIIS